MHHKELVNALIESSESFVEKFKEVLFEKKLTIIDFSNISGISQSTIYKIMSNPNKDFRISTLREIIIAVKNLEMDQFERPAIGVITTRGALDSLKREATVNNKRIIIKEYPATTIEEEIIQGVRAEREGVKGIVCGPVAATTLEKVVNVPVISLRFEKHLLIDALRNMMNKLS